MRYHDIVTERAAVQYYVHATPLDNVRSILKKGLLPNHTGEGLLGGRYTDERWQSLDGVYATNSPQLLQSIISGFDGDFALVILTVAVGSTLPDEDVIEKLMTKAYQDVCGAWGIDSHYAHTPSDYFDDREEAPDYEEHEDDLKNVGELWNKVEDRFHELATNNPKVTIDKNLLNDLVDYWRTFNVEEYSEGEVMADDWAAIKDKVVKKYRTMVEAGFQRYTSVRIPGPVTFKGRSRIVAIIGDDHKVYYGNVPDTMVTVINKVI